ncbi:MULTISPECIES: peptidase [Lacticaseibacillus]|uniref:Peptidase n=2 Tax=Lacticaseibacillus TaxID=2759736 RepID=A0AAN1KF54_LACCA|nr:MULTISPECIES: peptidase [Lacticaseibacillus]ARY92467.1 peptidase [Lacticaseibacillus casei]KAB1968235.1 peptidase [Lacticaseibacillus casei]WLV80369.1 peptidase [Lacticaseibacillus sp. NCIMB 15473]WNX24330.1 peptidase [Lacticaseibacillus casei]WNX27103.1 peptidase [Lacticaseibacillus casei]
MISGLMLLSVAKFIMDLTADNRYFHCCLAVLLGMVAQTWLTMVLSVGLLVFSVVDWRERAVSAVWFGSWCFLLLLLFPCDWFNVCLLAALVGGLAVVSHGLGSADVLLIAVFGGILQLEIALIITCMACFSAVIHWLVAHPPSLPFISHLAVGYGCVQLASGWLF